MILKKNDLIKLKIQVTVTYIEDWKVSMIFPDVHSYMHKILYH